MKFVKRYTTLCATLAFFVASAFVTPYRSIAQASADFPDVPRDHWAAKDVASVSMAGILEGEPTGLFNGDRPATRYEFAVALIRFFAVNELAPRSPLKYKTLEDLEKARLLPPSRCVDALHAYWASDAARLIQRFGQIQGNEQNQFQGDKPMTRYELAVALRRFHVLAKAMRAREPIK